MQELVDRVVKKAGMSWDAFRNKMLSKGLTVEGGEITNPVPIAPPIGYVKQPHLIDQIKEAVRSEMFRRDMENADAETFEEADDFDVPDDPFPFSQYENEADIPVRVLLEEGRKAIAEKQRKADEDARAAEAAEPPTGRKMRGKAKPADVDPEPISGDDEE